MRASSLVWLAACAPAVTGGTATPVASTTVASASAASVSSAPRPKVSLTGGLILPDTAAPTASAGEPPTGPGPACSKDEDCWSRTCCPATKPAHCVHASLAKHCALKDVACAKASVVFTCACVDGACTGRLPQ